MYRGGIKFPTVGRFYPLGKFKFTKYTSPIKTQNTFFIIFFLSLIFGGGGGLYYQIERII